MPARAPIIMLRGVSRLIRTPFFTARIGKKSHNSFLFSVKSLSDMTQHHTSRSTVDLSHMTVYVLPALQDNYMYLVVDKATKEAAIVDPVYPQAVIEAVSNAGVNLTTVLTTHHHWDHAGGNKELAGMLPGLTVCGNDDRIEAVNKRVQNNDQFNLGKLSVTCLETPCHTTGHICYYVTSEGLEDKAVFTGDTLFIGGCGRFFEGTPKQMYHALCEVLASLPGETQVYCGHEYTLSNLRFAEHVEPGNSSIQEKKKWTMMQREQDNPTVPSTIAQELSFNPFMRVRERVVQEHTKCHDPVVAMGFIRSEKDNFKAKV